MNLIALRALASFANQTSVMRAGIFASFQVVSGGSPSVAKRTDDRLPQYQQQFLGLRCPQPVHDCLHGGDALDGDAARVSRGMNLLRSPQLLFGCWLGCWWPGLTAHDPATSF